MVARTSRCLQFHTTKIQTISGNNILVIYLSTNEHDIIPLGPQVRSLQHVGQGIERKRVRPPKTSRSGKGVIDKHGPEQGNAPTVLIEDAHTSYINDFNVLKKRSLKKIGLAK